MTSSRCAVAVALTAFSLAGCVRRQLTVTSSPAGALVYMNEREVGRTPFTTDIGWYGNYDMLVRKDGYQTIESRKAINAPWWGYPPFDLVAELMPFHPTDHHALNFVLTERPADVSADVLVARGLEMKRQLPTTQASAN